MFNAEEYIQSIHAMDHGEPRLEVMKQAISAADAASDAYWGLYFRHEYIKESCFHVDNFKAVIMFPEYLKLFDDHPELEAEMYADVMWVFKWILEDMTEYYQVKKADIEKYFEEYRKRCEKYGFSLRVYYMKKSRFMLTFDREGAKELYAAFRSSKRDGNCDCEACEINYNMRMALEFGDEEEALRVAAPLFSGEKRCAEVPHVSYGFLTHYYLYKGNLESAAYYSRLCRQLVGIKPEFLLENGFVLELLSVVHPQEGWSLFKSCLKDFAACKNPLMRLGFARGAYRLLHVMAEDVDACGFRGLSVLPVSKIDGDYKTADLEKYFYDFAVEQSQKLDKRNGSTYYMDLLQKKLPASLTNEDGGIFDATTHGFTDRMPYVAAGIPGRKVPDTKVLFDRLKNFSKKENIEILSDGYEPGRMVQFCIRYEDHVYDIMLLQISANVMDGIRPGGDLDPEIFARMQKAPNTLLVHMNLGDDWQQSFQVMMKYLTAALPDMIGVVNLVENRAHCVAWAKFRAEYEEAVVPQDMFTVNVYGEHDLDEVWVTTKGLRTFGIRELELVGAVKENFSELANVLLYTASVCIENKNLPDAGETIALYRADDVSLDLTWDTPENAVDAEKYPYASKAQRDCPTAVLKLRNGESISDYYVQRGVKEIPMPRSNYAFVQKIELARKTYPIFRKALNKPYDMAAVRLRYSIPDEMRREAGYSNEILWAEIAEVTPDGVYAVLKETSDYLPDLKLEDRVKVEQEDVTAWSYVELGEQWRITEADAFFLM